MKCQVFPSRCDCAECSAFWQLQRQQHAQPAVSGPIKGPASISAKDMQIDADMRQQAKADRASGWPYK